MKMPPWGVHGLLWPGKGSVLSGLLFLASGGEHAVAAKGSFRVYMLVYRDE